jgi:hypothetical protein
MKSKENKGYLRLFRSFSCLELGLKVRDLLSSFGLSVVVRFVLGFQCCDFLLNFVLFLLISIVGDRLLQCGDPIDSDLLFLLDSVAVVFEFFDFL